MADSGFLSDTDDSAVQELISQAQELCVLEQVSAINCSGFTDSDLPSELENRFRKLKSFPLTKSGNKAAANSRCEKGLYGSKSDLSKSEVKGEAENDGAEFGERSCGFSGSKKNPDGILGLERGSRRGHVSSPSNSEIVDEKLSAKNKNPNEKKGLEKKSSESISSSSDTSSNDVTENAIFSPSKQTPHEKKKSKSQLKSSSSSSPASSPNSRSDSPSPPRKIGCFWCSPKKVSRQKSRESNKALDMDLDWGKNDDLLSDLNTFSVKEQQKILKMAMKEQQKINREAEKIVKWAKQASARMSFHDIEEELSDDEITKRV